MIRCAEVQRIASVEVPSLECRYQRECDKSINKCSPDVKARLASVA